jgi:hypothetical protein
VVSGKLCPMIGFLDHIRPPCDNPAIQVSLFRGAETPGALTAGLTLLLITCPMLSLITIPTQASTFRTRF